LFKMVVSDYFSAKGFIVLDGTWLNLIPSTRKGKVNQLLQFKSHLFLLCKCSPNPTTRIPNSLSSSSSSQKPSHGDILGTKRGIIDPLMSKRPEKNSGEEKKSLRLFLNFSVIFLGFL
jgi:hypothetical protein